MQALSARKDIDSFFQFEIILAEVIFKRVLQSFQLLYIFAMDNWKSFFLSNSFSLTDILIQNWKGHKFSALISPSKMAGVSSGHSTRWANLDSNH